MSVKPVAIQGEIFTQEATDCSQDQTRTAQDQEIETRTIIVSSTRDSVGAAIPWDLFADERNLSKDWGNLNWASQSLTSLPNSPYPMTSVAILYLQNNQLTNVDGLRNLTNVDHIYLLDNQLTNVNGLSNLTSVRLLNLSYNQLTNVGGLSKLTSVNILNLSNNPLTNVDGLANVKVSSAIRIDATYSGQKLAANEIFCTDNPDSVFPLGYAKKSQLCESQ